mmetsp:Transcript_1945/g.4245  ORF Transcript_1945/g.4245 Transcript_1945/m.4245 type:complete len:378 (+) Transcript_1945:155-1288(+)
MPLKLRVRAVEHLKASVAVRGFAVCTPLGRSIRARERVNTLAIPPIAHDDVLYATLLIQNGAARHGVYPLIRVNVSGHDQVYSILEKHALHRRLHRIALSLVHDVGLVPRRVCHSHNKRRACVVDAAQVAAQPGVLRRQRRVVRIRRKHHEVHAANIEAVVQRIAAAALDKGHRASASHLVWHEFASHHSISAVLNSLNFMITWHTVPRRSLREVFDHVRVRVPSRLPAIGIRQVACVNDGMRLHGCNAMISQVAMDGLPDVADERERNGFVARSRHGRGRHEEALHRARSVAPTSHLVVRELVHLQRANLHDIHVSAVIANRTTLAPCKGPKPRRICILARVRSHITTPAQAHLADEMRSVVSERYRAFCWSLRRE